MLCSNYYAHVDVHMNVDCAQDGTEDDDADGMDDDSLSDWNLSKSVYYSSRV